MSEKYRTCQNKQTYGDSKNLQTSSLNSKEDVNPSISKLYNGNLVVLGKIWIYMLKIFILGYQNTTKKDIPCEPESNLKRFSELPTSEYERSKDEKKRRLVFNVILPYVTKTRENCEQLLECGAKEMNVICDKVQNDARTTVERIKNSLREEDNYNRRVQLVAGGGILGLLKPGGLPTRLFCTACGLGATGWLCFPDETEDVVRRISDVVTNCF